MDLGSSPSPRSRPSERIGVILGQVGTPQNLDRPEVRRYLREFLSDDRIIDLPRWRWKPILHLAVLPTRPRTVARHFSEIWTDAGSPLSLISETQRAGVQERLGEQFQVELGMAYSEPSMGRAVANLEEAGIRRIVVLPLFPQFCTSTTASIQDAVTFAALGRSHRRSLPTKKHTPSLRFVHPFHDDPPYVEVLANSVRRQLESGPAPDRIIVSFHGLPLRYVEEGDPYRDHCQETARLLIDALDVPSDMVEVAYQARFGRAEWLQPYLQTRLREFAAEGIERPVIVAPGFTSDCLETLHELDVVGRQLFAEGGGDPSSLRVLRCLNDETAWLDYVADLITRNAQGW